MTAFQFNMMVYFLQTASLCLLIAQLGERRRRSLLAAAGCYGAMGLTVVLLWPVWNAVTPLRAGLMIGYLAIASYLVCGGSLRKRLLTVFGALVLMVAADLLGTFSIMAAYQLPLAEVSNIASNAPARMVAVVIYAPLFITLSTIWLLWRNHLPAVLKAQISSLVVALSIVCLICLRVMTDAHPTDFIETQSIGAFGLTGFIMFCQVFFYQTISSAIAAMKDRQKLEELQLRQKMSYEYYLIAKNHETELSRLRHDMKNQLQVAKSLMETRPEQASSLLDALDKNLNRTKAMHWTDIDVMNTILAVKSDEANRHNIRFTAQVGAGTPPLSDAELTSLLCNLLDNAIEGCRRSGSAHPEIFLKAAERVGMYAIRVENTCDVTLFPEKGQRTVKRDRERHGIGMEVIRQIAAAHGGTVTQNAEDSLCVTDVVLSGAEKKNTTPPPERFDS